jgi:ABC-2 type transport system permease protein
MDADKNKGRQVVTLLQSSPQSWLRASLDTQPDLTTYPQSGFPVEGERKARALAVSIRGSFESYFKGKPSPLQPSQPVTATATSLQPSSVGTLETSPDTARLVAIGSSEFLDDTVLDISRNISQDRYLLNLQFLQNAVDWSVEDADLLSIRSRGTYARLLKPMDKNQQTLWEGLNYAVALSALIALGVVWNIRQRSEKPMQLV